MAKGRIMKFFLILLAVAAVGIVIGLLVVFSNVFVTDRPGMEKSYNEISQEEAKEKMKKQEGHIITGVRPTCVLVIEAGGKKFYATLEDNSSAKALTEKLNAESITVNMHDYGNFEKVGALPFELPRNDRQITTEPGDIILYEGNQITVYYGTNSWNFTRLAKIENTSRENLLDALGSKDVSVKFYLEWAE